MRYKGGVCASLGQQSSVRPRLGYAPTVDHDNLVRVDDGGEAMGDEDDRMRTRPDEAVECLLYLRL